jgi:penicillin-insensitive murein endopeptidase
MYGDGTSVSIGTASHGALRRGVALPSEGDGYVMPPQWRARGANYGTEELVGALVRAARAVQRERPGGLLGVADLSPRGGGRTLKHHSHENGRDVDLLYFAVDDDNQALRPADTMVKYDGDGNSVPRAPLRPGELRPVPGWEPTPRHFDLPRNWALVRALLLDPEVEVQWIFIADDLRTRLIEYASQTGESIEVIDRAAAILHRPTDSLPHDDHMHVRVFCDPADRMYGCNDGGPVRWWKKHYKYMEPAWARFERQALPPPMDTLPAGPVGLLLGALHLP